MATLAARRDAFMPRPPGGMGRGLVLALLVHGGLIAALAIGVNWRSSSSTPLQAELWAAVPQVAAPRAAAPDPTPTPPPPRETPAPRPRPPEPAPAPPPPKAQAEAQIKIEEARKEKQRLEEAREQERREKEAARKLEQAKAEQARKAEAALAEKKRQEQQQREKEQEKAEAARLAEARAAAVKRMQEQAGGSQGEAGAKGTAAQSAAPSAGYPGRVIARIKPNIVFVDDLATNPEAEVLLRLAPDGRILSQRLVRSSGVKEWDQAVQRAIERTEILPRDVDGRVPPSMVIAFRPRE